MPLNSLQGEDDIITQLKTIAGVDVFNGEYTSDGYVPQTDANTMFKPYLTVKFNGAFPAHDNGITTPDLDTQRATFSVYVITPDDRVTRNILNQVRVKMLTNFHPTDGSTLSPTGGQSFIDASSGLQRYCHVISFSYYFNLS
jgi:hypothetical protein